MRKSVLLVGDFLSKARVYASVGEDLAERLSANEWTVLATSHKLNRLHRLFDMLSTVYFQRRHYEVAHVDVFSGDAFIWAELVCWALRCLNKPYVLTLRGGNLPAFASRWPGRVTRLLRSAAVVTSPSRFLLSKMKPHRDEIRLLPNPIDVDRYPYLERSHPRPRLVWLRSFHEIYNPTLVPRILAELMNNFPSIHVTMTGPDKGDGSLQRTEQLSARLGVRANIAFPGPVPKKDVPHRLGDGDIFINTTNVDNAPVSVMEAMACGLVVVSTNVGGISHLLEDEKDSLLVPPDDPVAFARALRRVLTEPGLAARLSAAGRRKAQEFDWKSILSEWETLLTVVANRPQSQLEPFVTVP